MTIQEIKEVWYASIYDQQLNDTDDVNAILEALGSRPQRVLEAACGTGRILLPLAKAGHLAEGFDLAKAELARCTEKLQPYPNARCYSMDGLMQDWGADFDAVILSGNLLINLVTQGDYTFAQQEFLRQAAKALRPGGHLFLSFDCFDRPAVDPGSMEEIAIFSGTDERGTFGKFILVPIANGYNPVTRVDISPRRYEITPKNGALHVFEEMRKKHFPTLAEVHGWLQAAGLKIEWEYGGFDRRPMDESVPSNTAVIWAVK